MQNNSFFFIIFTVLLLEVLIPYQSIGQREIILKRGINIKTPGLQYLNNECDYELLIPSNRPGKQDILDYAYTIKPKNLIKAPDDEVLAKWEKLSFFDLQKTKIEVQIKLKIYTYDLKTAINNPVINNADLDTLKYLKEEENFQVNSKIMQTTANNIIGSTREEIVHGIFDFVVNKLDYKKFSDQNRSAKKALNQGAGDCTEYSELMVTLCRAKNIPARIEMGLILRYGGEIGYHNWVEVFFSQYGWVAFDPTWADGPNANTTFYSMKNSYIQLSNRRFIKNIFCTCNTREYDFSYKPDDNYSEFDPLQEEKALFKKMYKLYSSNEPEKALNILDTLISFKTNLYDYYMFKGVIYARLGNFDKGIECLQVSLTNAKSNNKKIQSLYAFSNYFALKGDKDYAVMYLKKSIELGFKDYSHLLTDKDFDKMKDYPPLVELENDLKLKVEKK